MSDHTLIDALLFLEQGLWIKAAQLQIPALPFAGCWTWGKLHDLGFLTTTVLMDWDNHIYLARLV